MDLVGPLERCENENKYILTCQYNLSKCLIATTIQNQTVEEVSEALLNKVILIFGIPSSILTDQGTNLRWNIFKRLCKLLKIQKISTTAYQPESNGALERTHRTLVNYLRCFCQDKRTNWDTMLPLACFIYNTTPHTL